MEDKEISMGMTMLSVKRIELLLEQILIQTTATRHKDIPSEERQEKVKEVLTFVEDNVNAFVESLPPIPKSKGSGSFSV